MSRSLWGCSGTVQITTSWNLSYQENVTLTLGLFRYSIDHNQLEPQLLGECLAHSGAVQVQYISQPVGTSAIRRMSRSLWGCSGTVQITTSWNLSYQENVTLTLGLFRYSIDHNQLEPQLLGECLAHSGAVQVQYRSQPVGTSAIGRMSRSLWGCSGTGKITTSWNLSYWENVSLTLGLFRYSIDHNQLEPQLLGECLAHSGAVQVQYRSQPVGTSAIRRMSRSLWGCSGTGKITNSWNLSYWENVSLTLGLFRYSIDHNQLEPQLLGNLSRSLWGCSGTVYITTSWNLSYQENVSLTLGLFRYSIDHNQLEPQLLGECHAHSGAVQVQYRSQPVGTSAIRKFVSLTLGLFRYSIYHNQLEPQLLGECLAHSGAVQVQYRSQPVGTSAIRRMSRSLWGCSGTVQIITSWNLSYQENVSLTLGLFRYSIDHNQLEPQLLGECLAHSGAVQVLERSQPVGTSAIGRMSHSLWGCSGTVQITTSWNLSYWENVSLTLGLFRYSIDHNQLEPQLLGECLAHSGAVQVQYRSQPVGTSAIRRMSRSLWGCSGTGKITNSWNLSYWENVSLTLGLFRYSIDHNQLEPQLLGECLAHSGAVQVQYRSQPVGTSAIRRMSRSLWGCSGTVQMTTSWNLSYQENVSLTLGLFRYSIDHNQLEPQ